MRKHHLVISGFLLTLIAQQSYGQTEISGAIQGTLPAGEYVVTGDLEVATGTSLHLQHGTTLRFRDGVNFDINGPLFAEGIEEDSIYFEPEAENGVWGGLNYHDFSGYHQTLRYCVITGSNSSGVRTEEIMTLYIRHCRFSYNSATQYGGAIAWNHWEHGAIDSCEFSFNQDYAICFYNSGQGVSYSELNIHDNQGGVRIMDGPVTLTHCIVRGNSSTSNGGGIYITSGGVHILYCLIAGNSATGYGGGIYEDLPSSIRNCTIVGNSSDDRGAGIYVDDAINCINTIIAYNSGLCAVYSPAIDNYNGILNNNLFYENQGDNIWLIRPGYTGFEVLSTVNFNGDSCDAHYNLFVDPMFVEYGTNYNLLSGSPCINAGDPSQPPDPDGSIADIGAYPTGVTAVEEPEQNTVILRSARLLSSYPNPFNMSTTIPFELPRAGSVDIVIYNSLGQVVTHLVHGMDLAGNHIAVWDGRNDAGNLMGSGVYFITLQAQDYSTTRKIVMVK